ncbi:hypothetical protein AAG570_013716 [Ranatra chinensis]|uniref:Uncharacterized protein n=1 Tax=Ranatra chinensis TaxID=642074 RepID=A0ABD0YDA3_9HEMI
MYRPFCGRCLILINILLHVIPLFLFLQPRSFVVLKTEFDQGGDPPIWRIDGNSLLQKYMPFKEPDGTTLYKSTSVYSGWSINSKDSYYPAPVVFKRQQRNDVIIQFERSQVKT